MSGITDSKQDIDRMMAGISWIDSSVEIEKPVKDLIRVIFRDFIVSWYLYISNDPEFGRQVLVEMSHVTKSLERRAIGVDWATVLLVDIPNILRKHIEDYRECRTKSGNIYGKGLDLSNLFALHQPHWVSLGLESEKRFLEKNYERIIQLLLSENESESYLICSLLTEILVSVTLPQITRVSDSATLHEIALNLLTQGNPEYYLDEAKIILQLYLKESQPPLSALRRSEAGSSSKKLKKLKGSHSSEATTSLVTGVPVFSKNEKRSLGNKSGKFGKRVAHSRSLSANIFTKSDDSGSGYGESSEDYDTRADDLLNMTKSWTEESSSYKKPSLNAPLPLANARRSINRDGPFSSASALRSRFRKKSPKPDKTNKSPSVSQNLNAEYFSDISSANSSFLSIKEAYNTGSNELLTKSTENSPQTVTSPSEISSTRHDIFPETKNKNLRPFIRSFRGQNYRAKLRKNRVNIVKFVQTLITILGHIWKAIKTSIALSILSDTPHLLFPSRFQYSSKIRNQEKQNNIDRSRNRSHESTNQGMSSENFQNLTLNSPEPSGESSHGSTDSMSSRFNVEGNLDTSLWLFLNSLFQLDKFYFYTWTLWITVMHPITHLFFQNFIDQSLRQAVRRFLGEKNLGMMFKNLKRQIWPNDQLPTTRPPVKTLEQRKILEVGLRLCLMDSAFSRNPQGSIASFTSLNHCFDEAVDELIEITSHERINRHVIYLLLEVLLVRVFPEWSSDHQSQKSADELKSDG